MHDAASLSAREPGAGNGGRIARWCGAALLLAVSVSAYWGTVAESTLAAIDATAERWRSHGYAVGHGAPDVSGFPFSVRVALASPQFVAPGLAWEWSADAAVLSIDLWRPRRIRFDLPGIHRWVLPTGIEKDAPIRHVLTISTPAASGALLLGGDGTVQDWSISASDAEVTMPNGAVLYVGRASLSVERHAAASGRGQIREDAVRFDGAAEAIVLPAARSAHALGAAGDVLGQQIDLVAAAGLIVRPEDLAEASAAFFDGALAGRMLSRWRAAGGRIDVTSLRLSTREIDCRARGTIGLDLMNRPTGQLAAVLRGHDPLIDALVRTGRVRGEDGAVARVILGLLVRPAPDGGPPVLEIPIVGADGVMLAGPVPLLALPTLAPP